MGASTKIKKVNKNRQKRGIGEKKKKQKAYTDIQSKMNQKPIRKTQKNTEKITRTIKNKGTKQTRVNKLTAWIESTETQKTSNIESTTVHN